MTGPIDGGFPARTALERKMFGLAIRAVNTMGCRLSGELRDEWIADFREITKSFEASDWQARLGASVARARMLAVPALIGDGRRIRRSLRSWPAPLTGR